MDLWPWGKTRHSVFLFLLLALIPQVTGASTITISAKDSIFGASASDTKIWVAETDAADRTIGTAYSDTTYSPAQEPDTTIVAVPESGPMVLVAVGLLLIGVGVWKRRRTRHQSDRSYLS